MNTQQQPDRLDTVRTELERRKTEHEAGMSGRRHLRRWLRRVVAVGALLSLLLAGWFIFQFVRLNGDLIEGQIKGRLIPGLTGGRFPVTVGKISGDLLHGVEIENMVIRNPRFEAGGVLAVVPRVSLRYSLWDAAFGTLILERLLVDDLTLTLARDSRGVGLWDFGSASETAPVAVSAEPADEGKAERRRKALERQARAEEMADAFLQHIEFRNVGIIVPQPQDLFLDSMLGKILRLPRTTQQIAGVSVVLRKFPRPEFTDHLLNIEVAGRGKVATFQISRTRKTGDFHLSLDTLGQNFILAIQNRGAGGRAVQVFDGRNRDRLNLRFLLDRRGEDALSRVRGLSGTACFDQPEFFAGWLPEGSRVAGGLTLVASSPGEQAALSEAEIAFRLSSGTCILPEFPPFAGVSLDFLLKQRVAEVREFRCTVASFPARASGSVDITDPSHLQGSFTADVGGESMAVTGAASRLDDDHRRFRVIVSRAKGSLELSATQVRTGKRLGYEDLDVSCRIDPGGRVSDLVPSRLLPAAAGKAWRAWNERIDLVGPVRLAGSIPAPDQIGLATATLDLNGAQIVSRLNPQDRVVLAGTAAIASHSAILDGVSLTLDSLRCELRGKADFDLKGRKAEGYDLVIRGSLVEGRPFVFKEERLRAVLGLARPLPFADVVLEGSDLFTARVSHRAEPQILQLGAKKIRLRQGRRSWWIDGFRFTASTSESLQACRGRPKALDLDLSGSLFGFPINASAGLNLETGELRALKGAIRGEEFGTLMAALRDMPFAQKMLSREQLDLGGAFRFEVEGKGKLNRPALSGSCRFPALRVKTREMEAKFPFEMELTTSSAGEYQGRLSTKDAGFVVRQIPFRLEKAGGNFTFGKGGGRDPLFTAELKAEIFGAAVRTSARYLTKSGRFDRLSAQVRSSSIEILAREIAKIGRFNLPFQLNGGFSADFSAKGKPATMTGEGTIDFQRLAMSVPLHQKDGRQSRVELEEIGGRLVLAQESPVRWTADLQKFGGKVMGAVVGLAGKALLEKKGGGLLPTLDGVTARIENLSAGSLHGLLAGALLPEAAAPFREVVGTFSGSLALSGQRNRFGAEGEVTLTGGGFRHSAIAGRVEGIGGTIVVSRKKERPEPVLEVKNLAVAYGRAKLRMPAGRLVDPMGAGKISLSATAENVYPKEVMSLLAGFAVPRVSFPKEGSFTGTVGIQGTLKKPVVDLALEGGDLEVVYESDGNRWQLPIGRSRLGIGYDLGSGRVTLAEGILRFLNGELKLERSEGVLVGSRARSFNVAGTFDGVDLGSLQADKGAHVAGVLQGAFKANAAESGAREGELHLGLRNLKVSNLPLDPGTVEKIGLAFLEEPEFRTGQVNLYVSSEGDLEERGRLRVADGLFAGPDLRIELGESAFDPRSLQLSGKVMFNPQPLRRTKLGRKLGSLTRVLQDRETGVPYLDLTVSGTWDKPELIGKELTNKAKKRAKRNFIKSIFGGRRSHKASVEELKAWFPGWEPGQ